jgi:transposase-like protein
MPDFDELKQRIAALCARAASGHADAKLLVEIEDRLAEGYVCALRGDRHSQRLQRRFEALVDAVDAAEAAEQLRSVAREQRMVSQATQELRSQLAVMREHWIALGSERLGLA